VLGCITCAVDFLGSSAPRPAAASECCRFLRSWNRKPVCKSNRLGKIEPGKIEPGKIEPGKIEPGKIELGKIELGKIELGKIEREVIQGLW